MTEQKEPGFNRAATDSIKGIALIFMFAHHFFTFPEWWGGCIEYPTVAKLAPVFQSPFRICVPVFCFLTGYFYWYHKEQNWRYSLRKMTDLLISYWGAFALLALAAVLTAEWVYAPADVLRELFALKLPTMVFCWYVLFYLLAMLVIPLLPRLTTGRPGIDLTVWILAFPVLIRKIQESGYFNVLWDGLGFLAEWFPCLSFGFLCARYGWFSGLKRWLDALQERRRGLGLLLRMTIAAASVMGRWIIPGFTVTVPAFPWHASGGAVISVSLDLLYAPLFVFSLAGVVLWLPEAGQKVLGSVGRRSLMMWFLSCIFFGNAKSVFQPVLYLPRNPFLVLAWGLLLCWGTSFVLDLILAPVRRGKNRLFSGQGIR